MERVVNLAVRRRWGARGEPAFEPPGPGARGALIAREPLERLWRCVVAQVDSDPYAGLLSSMSDDLYDELAALQLREDLSDPFAWFDWVQLGPLRWVARECAMLEIAAEVLGCRVRSEYRAALSAMVDHCGLVLAFDPIAVVCDRAGRIEPYDDGLLVTFSDGSTVATPRRLPDLV